MRILGVIPTRLRSSRLHEKPLADIAGRPMVWWVYQQAGKAKNMDEIVVATDSERIASVCKQYGMNFIMTSPDHDTPTSRIYEVSTKMDFDYYAFISGDEPLIDPISIDTVAGEAKKGEAGVVNAMIEIRHAPDVIDSSNIKVVTNTEGYLLYTTRSPLPYPKGGLDFEYMKFVGIGAFSKAALKVFNDTPRSRLEQIEECDLLRFIEKGEKVKMVKVGCESLSVDTVKDLEFVRSKIYSGGGISRLVPVALFPSRSNTYASERRWA